MPRPRKSDCPEHHKGCLCWETYRGYQLSSLTQRAALAAREAASQKRNMTRVLRVAAALLNQAALLLQGQEHTGWRQAHDAWRRQVTSVSKKKPRKQPAALRRSPT